MKLVFLVSGNGGNLKFINNCVRKGFIKNCKIIVIADRICGALNYSNANEIENYIIKYTRNNNNELVNLLDSLNADLIITNIYKILDETIVEKYKGILINLHYSLLPAYSGLIGEDPIDRAIQHTKFIGTTLHYVDKEVDAGEIIVQGIVKNEGSREEIINKIFRMGCFSLLYYVYEKHPQTKADCAGGLMSNNEYIFSPNLNFNTSIFKEEFWKELRG